MVLHWQLIEGAYFRYMVTCCISIDVNWWYIVPSHMFIGRNLRSVHDGHLGEFVWRIESRIGDLSLVRLFSKRELIKIGHGRTNLKFGLFSGEILFRAVFHKNQIFVFWDLDLRMARIDPSRQGSMDEPREKLGECRKKSNISKKSKKPQKIPISWLVGSDA